MICGTTVIARHLARKNALYTCDNETSMAMIDSSMDLICGEVANKLFPEAILPILGYKSYTLKSFNESVAAFKSFLSINMKNMGEYLVGTTLTIADIYAAGFLFLPFALLVEEGQRKAFPKMTEWFKRVTADPAFVEIFGVPRYCKIMMKPALPAEVEGEKKDEKKEKKEKKGEKKGEKKAEKAEKKADAPAEEATGEDDQPKKKPPNPLDLLKPSPLILDELKREFLANKTEEKRREYIRNTFWKKFDAEGWALWFVDYIKAAGEGEILYKTSNLLDGFLWRIESMGRYGFGMQGIFGEEPHLEMRGVYMWRSTEIPFFVREPARPV